MRLVVAAALTAVGLLGVPGVAVAPPDSASTQASSTSFNCPHRGGAFGDPSDPTLFHICVNWRVVRSNHCPAGLHWSDQHQNCVRPEDASGRS